jgi:signal transduction histidine kinase
VVSLSCHLSAAADLLPAGHEEVAVQLTAARNLAAAALDEARRAIGGLRPSVLDDLGLAAGLESLARSLPQADVEVEADECRMAPHVETALYRIAQEALQNVTKHAEASRVRVELRQERDAVHLVVTDDGRGFDAERLTASRAKAAGGYGMVSIHERAALVGARVVIESRPGAGTTVTVSVPSAPPDA